MDLRAELESVYPRMGTPFADEARVAPDRLGKGRPSSSSRTDGPMGMDLLGCLGVTWGLCFCPRMKRDAPS